MSDRRYERRVPKTDPVQITWQEPGGATQSLRAQLFDLSASGACLITDQPVRVLSVVTFTHGGHVLTASVRYSKRASEGFMIGLEFDAPPTLT